MDFDEILVIDILMLDYLTRSRGTAVLEPQEKFNGINMLATG